MISRLDVPACNNCWTEKYSKGWERLDVFFFLMENTEYYDPIRRIALEIMWLARLL